MYELKTTGIRTDIAEEVELYKDETFSIGRMMEHLRKLLQLSRLSEAQLDILRNLCLLPSSGVRKLSFKQWLHLETLNDVNHLIRYGCIAEDATESLKKAFEIRKQYAHLGILESHDTLQQKQSAISFLLKAL